MKQTSQLGLITMFNRRGFLKATGAAALAVPAILRAQTIASEKLESHMKIMVAHSG
jgi:hypothetical protein